MLYNLILLFSNAEKLKHCGRLLNCTHWKSNKTNYFPSGLPNSEYGLGGPEMNLHLSSCGLELDSSLTYFPTALSLDQLLFYFNSDPIKIYQGLFCFVLSSRGWRALGLLQAPRPPSRPVLQSLPRLHPGVSRNT